jgi:hypothetical protein
MLWRHGASRSSSALPRPVAAFRQGEVAAAATACGKPALDARRPVVAGSASSSASQSRCSIRIGRTRRRIKVSAKQERAPTSLPAAGGHRRLQIPIAFKLGTGFGI